MRCFILLFIFITTIIFGEIRYVSKTGSNTPPYTSWETAADSIQSAIDISLAGDSIYVAPGVYRQHIATSIELTFIGSGIDESVIDLSDTSASLHVFEIGNNCIVKNFTILANDESTCLRITGASDIAVISNNKISGNQGISTNYSNTIIDNNIFTDCDVSIHPYGSFTETNHALISENIMSSEGSCINCTFPQDFTILNNIMYSAAPAGGKALFVAGKDSLCVKNNIYLPVSTLYSFAQFSTDMKGYFINNVVIGNNTEAAFNLSGKSVVKNNVVINSEKGFRYGSEGEREFKYNYHWNVETPYINFVPDSTNRELYPMFVDPDSGDYHLQAFSPLINAGDPGILDPDGSRSDAGLYGGPFGEAYTYLDLPPALPGNIAMVFNPDSSEITITWTENHEADFDHYNIYTGSTENFLTDTARLASSQTKREFRDNITGITSSRYYRVTSLDNQENESEASEAAGIVITTTGKIETVAPDDFRLFQNYPNPFNPETVISFRLQKGGNVKLVIYDLKGEKVTELLNESRDEGYYEIRFSLKDFPLASGIYIYRIDIKSPDGTPVFSDMKKMVVLK